MPTWNSHVVNIMTKHLCMLMNKQLITICTYHVRRMKCAYKSAYNYFQQKQLKQMIDIGSSLIFPCSPCQTHTYFFSPNLNKLFHGKYMPRYKFTQIYSKRIFFVRFVPTVIRPLFIYLSIKREYDVIPLFRKFGAVSTIKCKITFAMRLLLSLKLFNFFRTIFCYLFARHFSMSPGKCQQS